VEKTEKDLDSNGKKRIYSSENTRNKIYLKKSVAPVKAEPVEVNSTPAVATTGQEVSKFPIISTNKNTSWRKWLDELANIGSMVSIIKLKTTLCLAISLSQTTIQNLLDVSHIQFELICVSCFTTTNNMDLYTMG
jgi:hypothetical protein